jgi:5'-3' exonuclease
MSNSHNKQAFINMLCEMLNEIDIRYKNVVDDADLTIAQTAVDCALSSEVIVISEDTDLLVLLIHHVNQQCKRVIFKSDKMTISKKMKIWNIQQTKDFLGEDICHLLPFLHIH